jgi:hypothetical protein
MDIVWTVSEERTLAVFAASEAQRPRACRPSVSGLQAKPSLRRRLDQILYWGGLGVLISCSYPFKLSTSFPRALSLLFLPYNLYYLF